jgi:hypothetical protein
MSGRALALVALVFAVIRQGPLEGQAFVRRDSAGIVIAENRFPIDTGKRLPAVSARPAWQFPDTVVVRGKAPGDIRDASLLPTGGSALIDGQHSRLILLDSLGRPRGVLGGPGMERGDFNFVATLLHGYADTIVAWDPATGFLSGRRPDGRLVLWQRFKAAPTVNTAFGPQHPNLTLLSRFRDGSFLGTVLVPRVWGGQVSEVRRDSMDVVHVDRKGDLLIIARVIRSDHYFFRQARLTTSDELPFGRRGSLAAGPSSWYVTKGDAFEIEERTPGGKLLRLIRIARPVVPVTPQDIRHFRESRLHQTFTKRLPSLTAALDWVRYPATLPAYTALVRALDGSIWARRFAFPGAPEPWDVFTASGVFRGTLQLPADFRVTEISHDAVLGIARPSETSEVVRLYRLTPPDRN